MSNFHLVFFWLAVLIPQCSRVVYIPRSVKDANNSSNEDLSAFCRLVLIGELEKGERRQIGERAVVNQKKELVFNKH